MERGALPRPPSVIEGVLDVTSVYYITIETRVSYRSPPISSSLYQASAAQETSPTKCRPVATVRPFAATQKGEQQGQDSDPQLLKSLEEPTFYDYSKEADENPSNENTAKGDNDISGEKSDRCITATLHDASCESRDEAPVFPSPSPPSPQTSPPLTQPSPSETATRQEPRDPCRRHRDKFRGLFGNPDTSLTFSTSMMEVCQNGEECHNGQGCAGDLGEVTKASYSYKETCETECLDEFLEELHLTHLRDYLKVLGCTCVRDLKLLEEPELNAVQLITRRRLLKRLESMSLHHEAPPSDCSLEGWLTWYGLTHISGFLNAIGVHTVADMGYLREEDLELLKPVTRRRILTACIENKETGKHLSRRQLVPNDVPPVTDNHTEYSY